MKFRCGRGDIEDLAFGHSAKNGVKNLKGAQAISEFHIGLPVR